MFFWSNVLDNVFEAVESVGRGIDKVVTTGIDIIGDVEDAVVGNSSKNSSYSYSYDDSAEKKAREEAKKRQKKEDEYQQAFSKLNSWNSFVDAYISDDCIRKNFKISNVSDISKIDSFLKQMYDYDFATRYKAYSDAEKSIQELNKQIAAVNNVMGAFK
jgi:hypothetical protein